MGVIYRSTNMYPQNVYIDGSVNNNFTAIINGAKATHYQLKIFTLANASVYDSTKLALSPNLANGATLSHTVPSSTLINGNQYKWTLQVWNDTDSATTREIVFSAYSTPVVTFSPPTTITVQEYNFTATYSQAQSIGLNYYKLTLYDSNNEIIDETEDVYDFTIAHTFEGLISGNTYGVRLNGEFQINGMTFDSGIKSFDVSYTELDFITKPLGEFNSDTSSIDINWTQVVQIIGSSSETISYTDNFIREGNTSLSLDSSSSYVNFDVDIPENFTLKFIWKPDSNSFTGKIIQLDDGAYEVGYDGSKFTYTINGVSLSTLPVDLYGRVFYIVLKPIKVDFNYIQLFDIWTEYIGLSWNDVLTNTWEEILLDEI